MKGFIVSIVLVMAMSSLSFAADFSPTILKLDAPEVVQYDFDGNMLEIPLTVSGTPATAVFLVHTKDQGASIGKVQNGHLGWHYVNSIDTCLYVSSAMTMDVGKNTVDWDGNDASGNMVPSGEYTYYFFGFDSVSSKKPVMGSMTPGSSGAGWIQQFDVDNNPLEKPIWYAPPSAVPQLSDEDGGYINNGTAAGLNMRAKWVIGNDPADETLVETTSYIGWGDSGNIALMPGDHSQFFVHNYIKDTTLQVVRKFKYVPNGKSEQVMDWADEGRYDFTNTSTLYSGPISDNISALWVPVADQSYPNIDNPTEIHYIDPDEGTQLRLVDLADWWIDADEWAKWDLYGHKMHAGPIYAHYSNGYIIGGGKSTCQRHMMNPYADEDEDVTVWWNGNGDYLGDRFFEESRESDAAWMCVGGSGPPWTYDISLDKHRFGLFSTYDLGALSFGLLGPDGTGIEYFAFAGEAAVIKYGQLVCDSGTAYDGLYMDNKSTGDESTAAGLWFVGQNSIKGTISASMISVDEAPVSFAVSQNAPNPFNPTTQISFNTADAGNVAIDVFNMAGQKVDSIANEYMSAGSHSVTWDASGFSAGVYFYTVESGNMSQTMKMTLIK